MSKTLSLNEVATILGVSPLLVVRFTHRKIKAEAIPCIHVGGELRFDVEEFQAWKKANWDEEAFAFAFPKKPRRITARERRVERLTSGEEFFPDELEEL